MVMRGTGKVVGSSIGVRGEAPVNIEFDAL